ncbi:MAG: NADAR family protein [Candidatus Hermodarchaeota archaeon]
MVIKEFKGKHRFLSNFYASPFKINNIEYKTVEHWFQSQKTNNLNEQKSIRNAKTPATAKALGKKCQLRDDWEQVKLIIMEEGVRAKFTQNPNLKNLLIETGDQVLEEGNRWKDAFWGIDLNKNQGLNHLGKILMKIRKEFL